MQTEDVMAVRQQLPPRRRRKDRIEPECERPSGRTPTQARVDEIDDLLDEIDTILEAQTVLVNFRQRSGQ